MIRYLLDTDITSLWLNGDAVVVAAVRARDLREIGIPITVAEEIWDGWRAVVRQAKDAERMAYGYARLTSALNELRGFQFVPFSADAITRHNAFKRLKLNVGGNDLKIAATALDLDATVVTNNESDFGRVPGLRVENWTLPQTPSS